MNGASFGIQYFDNTVQKSFIKFDDAKLRFNSFNNDFIFVSGNMGLSVNTPNEKLSVSGNISLVERSSGPSATLGFGKLFVLNNNTLYFMDEAGVSYNLTSLLSGSGSSGQLGYWNGTKTLTGSNSLTFDDTNSILAISSNIFITGNILPGADSAYNLGSSTQRWKEGFFAEDTIHIGEDGNEGTIEYDKVTGKIIFDKVVTYVGVLDGSGTTNNVTFWSDSDTVSGDPNFYWDAANDRLGLGTGAPNETLTVEGSMSLDSVPTPSSTSGYGKIFVNSADNDLYFVSSANVVSRLSNQDGNLNNNGVSSTGNVTFWEDPDTITGNANFYWDAANNQLGLGTTTPNEQLTVEGVMSLDEQSSEPSLTSGYGKVFVRGDELVYMDSGGTTFDVTLQGTGSVTGNAAANQVAFWTATDTIDGDTNFQFNNSTYVFTVSGSINLGGAGTIAGSYPTIGGGVNNSATGTESTVAGGNDNTASALESFVGGGDSNAATSENATVS
ncbi:MAG: hypothetical protein HRT90_04815, partial [Candidatus Margulisbacteria bacterium]|nr:hypothetical protein [Candidatus Margulisiibacteriota bacterium]